ASIPPNVTSIVRTSHTESVTSVEGSQPRFTPLLSVEESKTTWQVNMSSFPPKPWKLPVFVPMSTWCKAMTEMTSTSESNHINSTSSTSPASTRCCPALELTGCRQGCGVALDSRRAQQLGPYYLSHYVHPIKLQNKEHGQGQLVWPPENASLQEVWLYQIKADEFKHMMTKKQLIPEGCEVKYIPNCSLPWTNSGP
ncbi:hypothetical protein J0S82_005229, partial [Galemys pyrenaicus]